MTPHQVGTQMPLTRLEESISSLQRTRAARSPRSRKPLDAPEIDLWHLALGAAALLLMSACAQGVAERSFLAELKQAELEMFTPHQSNPAGALAGYWRAVHLGEQAFGPSHPVLVLPLARLGEYERVLMIYKENPMLTGSTWRLYAKARKVSGPQMTRREAMYLYLFGEAVVLNGLAAEASRLGQTQRAELLCRKALIVLLRLHGPADPLLRSQFAVLRQYCYQRRDWPCAERYARRIVDLDIAEARQRGHLGGIGSAANLQSLANICVQQGQSSEAATLYAKALEVLDRELRRNDPLIANCLKEYATVLAALGRDTEAGRLRERARQARADSPQETGGKRAGGV